MVKRHFFVQGEREFSRAQVTVELELQKSFSLSSGPFWVVRHQLKSQRIRRSYKLA